jgi:hypothetical protein
MSYTIPIVAVEGPFAWGTAWTVRVKRYDINTNKVIEDETLTFTKIPSKADAENLAAALRGALADAYLNGRSDGSLAAAALAAAADEVA